MATDGWLGGAPSAPARELRGVCLACVDDAGVDGAGLAVFAEDGTPETVHATDRLAARIEDLQFTTGEGPCFEAARTGVPVLVPDAVADAARRWPAFGSELVTAGVGAVFAFPIRLGTLSLGCLDLHRRRPGPMSREQLAVSVRAVDQAAELMLALTDIGLGAVAPRTTYRMVIHQAAGMVMMQLDVSVEEALVRLRATAYAEGKSINAVAGEVVSRRRRMVQEDA